MRVMGSDRRKCRSGQTHGLYFVVKSGYGAPRDKQGTFCSNVQAHAHDPSSRRSGIPSGRREPPTAAPPLSSMSPPRRPHTPETPPPRARPCATARDQHRSRRGRPPRQRGDKPHPPPSACVWVSPPWPPWRRSASTSPARTAAPDAPPRRRPHRPPSAIWSGSRRRRPPRRRNGGSGHGGPAR